MFVLGIETSGLDGTVALVRDGNCLGERSLNRVGRRHAQSLVLEIGELLRAHGTTPRDVELVAVSRGPGSFTGLRVGMVCAKTFAYATGCQFIAVDTFLAIANNASAERSRLFVIENAQRDELFAGEYTREATGDWRQAAPIGIIGMEEFRRARSESDSVTGPGVTKFDPADVTASWLVDAESRQPRANIIAKIGQRQFESQRDASETNGVDFWRALPFYLRPSAAEEKLASQSAKGAP